MTAPPPNPFMDPDLSEIDPWDHSQQTELAITRFLDAYNDDPSQYGFKKPADLIHPNSFQNPTYILALPGLMESAQLYKFIVDTGLAGTIPNERFICGCFYPGEASSEAYIKYLFELCPNRINLMPANILLSLFVADARDMTISGDALKLFWDHCPQLKDPNFLNSEIRMPDLSYQALLNLAIACLDDGGYNGDLASRELEQRYTVSFLKENICPIDYIMSRAPLTVLQSFIENSDIDLKPLYLSINPKSDTQDGLRSLDDIPDSIKKLFLAPMVCSLLTLSSECILWYLNWWKNDVLGDVMSLHEFKTFIFGLFPTINSQCPNAPPLVEYLGADFLSTLSSNQVFNSLNTTLIFSSKSIKTSPLFKALLSIPSVADSIKDHYVYFTRESLHESRFIWDCAELFLKLGGLTMEQIWSDHSHGDNSEDDPHRLDKDVFTLESLIPSLCPRKLGIPFDFVEWLSYQPGTQEQLIKLVKSKKECACAKNHQPHHRFFTLMLLSYRQQMQRQKLSPEQQEEYLKLFPLSKSKQSAMSWLQSFIVYTEVDYMNVKFTTKLCRTDIITDWLSQVYFSELVGDKNPIGLSHFPIILDVKAEETDDGPAVLLEDIIQGVIASLLMK